MADEARGANPTRLELTVRAAGVAPFIDLLHRLQDACNLLHDVEGRIGIGPEFSKAYRAVAEAHTMLHCASRKIIPIIPMKE